MPATAKTQTIEEFLSRYDPDGKRRITEVDATRDEDGLSPFVIIRHGDYAMIINPLAFDDHLCTDIHSFANGKDATSGVFGMTEGQQHSFAGTGTTSYGWPSAALVSVLIGKQATEDVAPPRPKTIGEMSPAERHDTIRRVASEPEARS